MSQSASAPTADHPFPIAELAEFVHRAVAPAVPALVSVSFAGDGNHRFGVWPGVAAASHPADPLIGFLAPDAWDVIGLAASARTHQFPGPPPPEVPVEFGVARVTAVHGRDGSWASVIDDGDLLSKLVTDTPEGWVPDALSRAFGHRTPAPTESPGAWLEAIWLDRLATRVLKAPAERWSWAELAAQHPFAGDEGPVPPEILANRTLTFSLTRSWTGLRQRLANGYQRSDAIHPPDVGTIVDAAAWFDDGSFSRWVQRNLVAADILLPDIQSVLPKSIGNQLRTALTTVDPA